MIRVDGPVTTLRAIELVAAGLVGGVALSLVALAWLHGSHFTIGWILGYSWPSPQNRQIGSAWWLLFGFVMWAAILRHLLRRGRPMIRVAAAAAGPTAALVIFATWATSLLQYAFRVWPIDSPPTGIRWLLDGPLMAAWRRCAHWLLWQLGLNGATQPVHYADGSSVSHLPGTLHALGLMNEAMLAVVLVMLIVLAVHGVLDQRLKRHEAA